MNDLTKIPITQTNDGTDGILASVLYKNLDGDSKNFQRWARRNILENYMLIYGTDYIELLEGAEIPKSSDGRNEKSATFQKGKRDYILSLSIAQKLALSVKTPKQAKIVQEISDYMIKSTKEPMIPVSKIADLVNEMVKKTMADQNTGLRNYDALKIESDKKDKAIESLQLQGKVKHNNLQSQATIRQIVNLIVRETPYYSERKDSHQVIYNMVISDFFKLHPVRWKSDWYALKDKEYAKSEFDKVKVETGEKPESKLDWIRIIHPESLAEITESARNIAIKNLPYDFFQKGGTLPV